MPDYLSVVTPTFNEVENIEPLTKDIKDQMKKLEVDYEHIIIDNCSDDGTVEKLRSIAQRDKNVKVILNMSNYGHIRSPYYGLLQAEGDAVILMCSDFQHPVYLIKEYYLKWKNESEMVILGRKIDTQENYLMKSLRRFYYKFLNTISGLNLPENCTGDGLYDKSVVKILKNTNEKYPYLRGLISILGYKISFIDFNQPQRLHGKSSNNIFSLFDYAILGVIKHSYLPLRTLTIAGLFFSFASIFTGLVFLILKLLNWETFSLGIAPLLIGVFVLGGMQMLITGLVGEYLITLNINNNNHPLVIEKERINFK